MRQRYAGDGRLSNPQKCVAAVIKSRAMKGGGAVIETGDTLTVYDEQGFWDVTGGGSGSPTVTVVQNKNAATTRWWIEPTSSWYRKQCRLTTTIHPV
jgi:hypothetical protein